MKVQQSSLVGQLRVYIWFRLVRLASSTSSTQEKETLPTSLKTDIPSVPVATGAEWEQLFRVSAVKPSA